MKRILYILALVMLLFSSISAIFGGWNLITDPTGSFMKMPVEWLEYSPFKDFLIPGIILFVFNGIFSLAIFLLTLFKYRHYALLVIFQGGMLFTWIVVQMIMLRAFHYLHVIYGGIGILLVAAGLMLYRRK
jgi:hypothetical protein